MLHSVCVRHIFVPSLDIFQSTPVFFLVWVHDNEVGVEPAYVAKQMGPFEAYLTKYAPADAATKVSLVPDTGARDFSGHKLLTPNFLTKVKKSRTAVASSVAAAASAASTSNASVVNAAGSSAKKPAGRNRKSIKSQRQESTEPRSSTQSRPKRPRKSINYRGM